MRSIGGAEPLGRWPEELWGSVGRGPECYQWSFRESGRLACGSAKRGLRRGILPHGSEAPTPLKGFTMMKGAGRGVVGHREGFDADCARHTHTHTRSFKDFHTHHWQVYAPDTICKRPIKKNKKAPGREKTETAPRKNSLGPTIRWQDGRKGLQGEGGPLAREGSTQWGSAQWAVASWAAGRVLRAGGALEVRREESKVCRLGIIAAQRSPLRRTRQIGPGMLWNQTHTTSCKPRAGWCC